MPKIRLTKTNVEKIQPPETGRVTYQDNKILGLRLRVSYTGVKTWSVRSKINGKDIRVTLGRFPNVTASQAEVLAKKNLSDIAQKINPNIKKKSDAAKSITLKQCFDEYKKSRSNLKKSTAKEYENTLNQYLSDWLEKPLLSITRDKVEARHSKIGKKSPTRANKTMRILRALFEYAHGKYEDQKGEPVILHNPVKRLTHVKAWFKESRKSTYIKPADIKAWYKSVNSAPTWMKNDNPELSRDYLLLLAFTGLRRTEAAKLRWQDIDFKDNTITVLNTKNSYIHILPITTFLHDLLIRRKAATKESLFLFPGGGKAGHLIDPKKAVKNIRDHSGVYFTPHDLRRTFITIAESLDIRDYILRRLLNHRSGGDVTGGYIITDVERLRLPMQKITDKILSLTIQKNKVINIDDHKTAVKPGG